EQLCFEIAPLAVVEMGQCAAVAVLALLAVEQTDTTIAGIHQRLQTAPGLHRIGLITAPFSPQFGRVDADQANAASVDQAYGIAVNHLTHSDLGKIEALGTEGLSQVHAKQRNEKGAHQGRLFQYHGVAHARFRFRSVAYLAPNTPKRCLKRSIRPPVSSTVCLPV